MGKIEPLAEKIYKVSYEDNGEKITNEYRLVMEESGAFHYGNGHCVTLFKGNDIVESWDARYDKRFYDEETFYKYAEEFVKDFFRKDAEIWGRVV